MTDAERNESEREFVDILFDGPPSHKSGRFVEVEDSQGRSISLGEWVNLGNLWALRIPDPRAIAMSDPNLDDLRRNLADATLSTEQMGAEILGLRESVSELAIKRRVDNENHLRQRALVEAERDALRAQLAAAQADAERYRHMRANAGFQDRNGPGCYWYLPRMNHELPIGERLDAAIDAARATKESK